MAGSSHLEILFPMLDGLAYNGERFICPNNISKVKAPAIVHLVPDIIVLGHENSKIAILGRPRSHPIPSPGSPCPRTSEARS